MCALRGVIYPILITHAPAGAFGKPNVDELRLISYCLAVAFVALSSWGR
jgi:hypothetical protein